VEAASFVTGAEEASLFLVDGQTQKVHLRAIQGGDNREVRRIKTEADDAIVRRAVATGQVSVVQDPHPDETEPGYSTIAVPLKVREKAIGALCARRKENPGSIADNDRYLLSALADHAAIAIENARLYKETQQKLQQRKQSEEAIRQLAYHDPLTGLPNRMLFDDRLGIALARARRYRQRVAVLLLDLDGFKEVNDRLGHSVGDQLLKAVGERLVAMLRASDSVCRMGGDEFLLLLSEIERAKHASRAAERILDIIRQPFSLDEHDLEITTSIGLALYPDDGKDGDTLVERADVAMYRAKGAGRDNWKRYGMDGLSDTSQLS
jgi:diguanylate cyclase (GGDEF)-like protein